MQTSSHSHSPFLSACLPLILSQTLNKKKKKKKTTLRKLPTVVFTVKKAFSLHQLIMLTLLPTVPTQRKMLCCTCSSVGDDRPE